jgi:hypothetical protein
VQHSALIAELEEEIREGALMAKHWTSVQPDLFEERPEVRYLGATEGAKALEQLQMLLMEAMEILGVQPEAGDDQDRV